MYFQKHSKNKNMAIAIKSIPTLKNKVAQRFVHKAETAVINRATVDFSEQVKTTQAILNKAKLL